MRIYVPAFTFVKAYVCSPYDFVSMTKLLYVSLALTVVGNVIYHLSQKSIPTGAHPLVSTLTSYVVAMAFTLLAMLAFPLRGTLASEIARLNWSSAAVGIAIVAVEVGFLLLYRSGWNVSTGQVTSNVIVALALIPAGALLFQEPITFTRASGVLFCLVGLALVTR